MKFTDEQEKKLEEVVKAWNDTQKFLCKVRYLSDSMKVIILNAYSKYGIESIKECFAIINRSSYLNGRDRKTHTSIEWALQDDNFAKIMNGNYLTPFEKNELEHAKKYGEVDLASLFERDTKELF